jgi:hypothetical protein
MVETTFPGGALIRLRSGFVRAFEEAAPAMSFSRLELTELHDLAEESLFLPYQVQGTWETLGRRGLVGEPEFFKELGQSLREYIEGALRVLRGLSSATRQAGQAEAANDLPSRLDAAARDLEQLRDRIFARWPMPDRPRPPLDRQMIEEAKKLANQTGYEHAADIPF